MTASTQVHRPVDLFDDYTLSIDGRAVTPEKTFEVFNPATGEVLAHAPEGTSDDIDAAVAAARAAFPAWSGLSWRERSDHIGRYADALEAHQDELARLLTLEQGKPLRTMRTPTSTSSRSTTLRSAWSVPSPPGTSLSCWACGRSPPA